MPHDSDPDPPRMPTHPDAPGPGDAASSIDAADRSATRPRPSGAEDGDRHAGFGIAASDLRDREVHALLQAYVSITDDRTRREVIELVKAAARLAEHARGKEASDTRASGRAA